MTRVLFKASVVEWVFCFVLFSGGGGQEFIFGAAEVAQQVKVPDNPAPISETHMVAGENQLSQVLPDRHTCTHTHVLTPTQVNT